MTTFSVPVVGVDLPVGWGFSSPAVTVIYGPQVSKVQDTEYGGDGTITGTVKVAGTPTNVPVARKVRLIRDVDAICIREVWSDPVTGVYTFAEIDRTVGYTVLSYDYTENFRAVVADRVVPT